MVGSGLITLQMATIHAATTAVRRHQRATLIMAAPKSADECPPTDPLERLRR